MLGLQSCYTAGWTTLGGNYFQNHSTDTLYYESGMNRFALAHPELMLDSAFVRKYHKFQTPAKEEEAFSGKNLYPLYPYIIWPSLKTWFIKAPDGELIYHIGLFNCAFPNTDHNSCTFSMYGVYKITNDRIWTVDLKYDDRKLHKKQKEFYLNKFEAEVLPLMKPFFDTGK